MTSIGSRLPELFEQNRSTQCIQVLGSFSFSFNKRLLSGIRSPSGGPGGSPWRMPYASIDFKKKKKKNISSHYQPKVTPKWAIMIGACANTNHMTYMTQYQSYRLPLSAIGHWHYCRTLALLSDTGIIVEHWHYCRTLALLEHRTEQLGALLEHMQTQTIKYAARGYVYVNHISKKTPRFRGQFRHQFRRQFRRQFRHRNQRLIQTSELEADLDVGIRG